MAKKKIICVIEDNNLQRLLVESRLKKQFPDAEIHPFSKIGSASNFIESNKIDALITDMHFKNSVNSESRVGDVIQAVKRRNRKALVVVNSAYGAAQLGGEIRGKGSELDDFRPSVASKGTGDDADTPTMRERAKRRETRTATDVGLLRHIDYFNNKESKDGLIKYLEGAWSGKKSRAR